MSGDRYSAFVSFPILYRLAAAARTLSSILNLILERQWIMTGRVALEELLIDGMIMNRENEGGEEE